MSQGALWSIVGTVGSRIFTLVSWFAVARFVGKEDFGRIGVIQSTVGLFGVFAGFGLGAAGVKYVAEYKNNDPIRAGRVVGGALLLAAFVSISCTTVLVLSAPYLAEHLLADSSLKLLLYWSSPLVFLGAVSGVLSGAMMGLGAFRGLAVVMVVATAIGALVTVAMSFVFGLVGCIASMSVSTLLQCVILAFSLRKEASGWGISVSYKMSTRELSSLGLFSVPAMLSSLTVIPVNWICNSMLVGSPGGYAEMGVFNAANQWRTSVLFIPNAISTVALPFFAEYSGERGSKFNGIIVFNIVVNFGVAVIAIVPIVLLADSIMACYGKGFENGASTLIVLVFSAAFMAVNAVLGSALVGRGRIWIGVFCNVIWAMVLLGVGNIWIHQEGAYGLARAILISYPVQTICLIMGLVRIRQSPPKG